MTITGLINERKLTIDNATAQNIYDFLLLAIKEQLPFGFERKKGPILYHDILRVNADFPLRDGIVITTHYYIENPAGNVVHNSPKLDFMNFKVVQISNDRVILYGGCTDHEEGKQEFEKLWQTISDTYTRKEHTMQNDLPGYVHPGLLALRQSMRQAEIEDEKKYLEELSELQQKRSSMMRQEANMLLIEGALRSARLDPLDDQVVSTVQPDIKYLFEMGKEIINIRYRTEYGRFKRSKGLEYLHYLLLAPHQDIEARQFVIGFNSAEDRAQVDDADQLREYNDKQDVADKQTIEALKTRYREIMDANDEFGENEDRAIEKQYLIDYLASATGKGHKPRAFTDEIEKTRTAVTKTIKRCLDNIEKQMPEFGRHLKASIHTGSMCRYSPQEPVKWRDTRM